MKPVKHLCLRFQLFDTIYRARQAAPSAGAKRCDRLAGEVITVKERVQDHGHVTPPYCVSRLIQFLLGRYRFYIYRKCPKINILGNDGCTPAWAAIVLLVGFATLLIFQRVKNNDSLFFSMAIVIFCTHTKLLPLLLQVAILICRFLTIISTRSFLCLHLLQSDIFQCQGQCLKNVHYPLR